MNIEKYIFGKKLQKMSDTKKIRSLKRSCYFLLVAWAVLIILLIVQTIAIYNIYHSLYSSDTTEDLLYYISFNLTDLDSHQREQVYRVVKEINPLYLEGQKEITVVRDIKPYMEREGLHEKKGFTTFGFNKDNGYIWLQYTSNESYFREILCHELLHTYMKFDDISHRVIYDLQGKNPCFVKNS